MTVKIYFLCMHILSFFVGLFNKKKYIIFESYPDFTGSPKRICQELDKRGYGSKYTFVWAVDKSQQNSLGSYKTVPFWGNLKFIERLKKNFILANAVLIVDSNRAIFKVSPKTYRIWTDHGGGPKQCTEYRQSLGKVDWYLALSDIMKNIHFKIMRPSVVTDINQVLELGFPANDALFETTDLKKFWSKTLRENNTNFNKIIGWMPTFRPYHAKEKEPPFPFGIPIIKTKKEFELLNLFLSEQNILLAIQVHHAQRRCKGYSTIEDLSNIVFISQEIKDELQITNANLMNRYDALITDYSAAYNEFILLNRPIAITLDDYNEYAKQVGFYVDFPNYAKGFNVYNFNDLKCFISEIAQSIDSKKQERQISLHKIHKYTDNQSTKRVVDFLIEKIKL